MNQSEQQFQELLAHAIARVKATLREHGRVPAFGLQLQPDGNVQLALETTEAGNPSVDLLIEHLNDQASKGALVACAIVHRAEDNQPLSVFLENNAHYCADVTIPFHSGSPLDLDVENMSVGAGAVRIFRRM